MKNNTVRNTNLCVGEKDENNQRFEEENIEEVSDNNLFIYLFALYL